MVVMQGTSCLEAEWKLFVECVMRIIYVWSSPGDWLSLAPHGDASTSLSHFVFLKPFSPPHWEIRIHPSPLHPLLQLEASHSSQNILEIGSECLFKLILDFLRWDK